MSRYVKDIVTSLPPDELERTVADYLRGERFKRVTYEGEDVWRRTFPLVGPQFVKTSPTATGLRVEAWVRYWILPGVSAGEMGIEGVFNSAPKTMLRKRLVALEQLLT